MGWFGGYFWGEEDEIKVKEFKKIFEIKSDEEAKELYKEIKTRLANKKDQVILYLYIFC